MTQCALNVTARDLAVMSATLGNGGVNPFTRQRIINGMRCQHALAVKVTAGLYENSGAWVCAPACRGRAAAAAARRHGARQGRAVRLRTCPSTRRATASGASLPLGSSPNPWG
ncbi:glutaminase [Variovorax sp. J22R115]|uniref:glutaminase n=1 Tax=Variovorax sp. J22R115 TaxID=3053509 RepID=UPI0034DF3355